MFYTSTNNDATKTGIYPRLWLITGVAAVAVAGLFALILVVARTPQLAAMPLFSKLFHEALVVHVDLSVLVWFLAIAACVWSRVAACGRARIAIPYMEAAALISFAGGAALIALSPLDGRAHALMSNYIPVINSPVFFIGLMLVGSGIFLQALHGLNHVRGYTLEAVASVTSAVITLTALVCFVLSARLLPDGLFDGQQYYDMLFWGGGHVLQFTHAQMLLVAWLTLAAALHPGYTLSTRWLKAVMAIGVVGALAGFYAYAAHDITGMAFRQFFTHKMMALGGVAPLVVALWVVAALRKARNWRAQRALASALIASLALFAYGGVLGFMIQGENVTIPAHYHGSIVAITIAFMGLSYSWLPQFGGRDVARWRLAFYQPIVLAFGQGLHITGLAWSGGYGVLRKTPGALEGGFTAAKAAMGLMGGGGLIAMIGGLMFVIVVWRGFRLSR